MQSAKGNFRLIWSHPNIAGSDAAVISYVGLTPRKHSRGIAPTSV